MSFVIISLACGRNGPNAQEIADLVTFTKEILNKKLHFSCSERK